MHNIRNVTGRVIYVGGNDRRCQIFEGKYPVSSGMAYNSYLIKGEVNILVDTADASIAGLFLENVQAALNGDSLNYVVVQHMEPDHSATLMSILSKYPEAKVITSPKSVPMIKQFFGNDISGRLVPAVEGEPFEAPGVTLDFINAPMVHWPEVIMTYFREEKVFFSADAFGSFGALEGRIVMDPSVYDTYVDEARRYYTNIVGKYGAQVQMALKKASAFDIEWIAPLHGYIWKDGKELILDSYGKWSTFTPEVKGVCIIAGSVYGNTLQAAEILAAEVCAAGGDAVVIDTSVKHWSYAVACAYKYSAFAIMAATNDGGIFAPAEHAVRALAAHGVKGRKAAYIDNGTWAAVAGKQITDIISGMKDVSVSENSFSIKSSLTADDLPKIRALAAEMISDP